MTQLADVPAAATPAPARRAGEGAIVRLAGTFEPGQPEALCAAVVARATRPGQVARTVVLDLGDGTSVDPEARRELCSLREILRGHGADLRLVISSVAVRRALAAGPAHLVSPEVLYPSLRAAVLAAYAERPGPGLVNGQMRAALAIPAETLGP